ncbi:GTP cyclohydrolase I [Streptomyces sp. NPDC091272]|uniref:GTP cyclohydrolase I n=1 Tax=Streptomyces sp. NPDC091272 TaxID=3365981 RepID=UPI00381B5055
MTTEHTTQQHDAVPAAAAAPETRTGPGRTGPGGPPAPVDPLEDVGRKLLLAIGEDPDRAGLAGTPARFARWWREFSNYEAGDVDSLFELKTDGQIVVVSDIEVWSLCEHHLLPFSCSVTIAYRPGSHVLGLSKFARIAHRHAHRLQVQERLVRDISDEISAVSGSPDVAVIARGEHLCMSMRGIRTAATMTSSVFNGIFADYGPPREELIATIAGARSTR